MKMIFSLIFLFLAPISAMAGEGTSGSGELFTTWNEEQSARANLTGGDGNCITTSVDIFVTRFKGGTSAGTSGEVRRIFVSNMTRMNICTGVLELSANGSGAVENFFFWDGGLFAVSASVGASLQLTNTVNGTVVPVRIDLVWAASGERTDYRNESLRFRPDSSWDKEVNFGMIVLSSATGSVTDGAFQYALTNSSAELSKNTRKTKATIPN